MMLPRRRRVDVTTLHHGLDVWRDLTPLIRRTRGARRAAVAYVTKAAHELLSLRAGDTVIVNASKRALGAGATDPDVLERWLRDDVDVYSVETLHAKVFVASRLALVGSANASYSAQGGSNEAVLETDDPDVIQQTRAYIDELLTQAKEVDDLALEQYRRDHRPPRGGGLPGVNARPAARPDFGPTPSRLYVRWLDPESSPAAVEQERRDRRSIPRLAGWQRDYFEDRTEDAANLQRDDAILIIWDEDDETWAALARVFMHRPRRAWSNVYYHYLPDKQVELATLNAALATTGRRRITTSTASVRQPETISTILDILAPADGP
jgi:hypothetical protein